MRKLVIMAVLLLAVSFIAVNASDDKPWFDMASCEMCKPIIASPGLMENMTWEHHSISNGMVTVTTIKPEFAEAYEKAHAIMMETSKELMAGKEVSLCGMCMGMGEFFAKGAKSETVETMHGSVMLVTSADAEVVTLIQKWRDRTMEEMAKMGAEEASETGHEGHNH